MMVIRDELEIYMKRKDAYARLYRESLRSQWNIFNSKYPKSTITTELSNKDIKENIEFNEWVVISREEFEWGMIK